MTALQTEEIDFNPQPGPQMAFLASPADIVIYGGAAGGGKSFALLLDPIRHYNVKGFGAIIFRKTSVQIRNEGGLWDESEKIYPHLMARPREFALDWKFPSGMSIGFSNLEYDKDVFNYQGAQIAWLGFDELTHFSEQQFFYMLSRNRSTCGVRPVVRCTTNPDPDSWVRHFIDWWIGADGYAIKERSGVLRWFIRRNDEFVWADSAEEIYEKFGRTKDVIPKSVTFIAAKLEDNKILMEKNPQYLGNLLSLNRVDRERLHAGNWNIRTTAGSLFKREWFPIVDQVPGGWIRVVRFWDRAATKPHEGNKNPDWTRGLKLYQYPDGKYCVGDLRSLQDTPGQVEQLIKNTASHDGQVVGIRAQQDPGSAGVQEADNFVQMLSGYDVACYPISKDKITRAKPVSAQAEWGNISVVRAPWNSDFFNELGNFPDPSTHDDIVDTLSGAFNDMNVEATSFDCL